MLSLHIHPKKPKILILKFLCFIEPLKLTILGKSLLFGILGAWRRFLCGKEVISLIETMKFVFFSDLFVQATYPVSRLAVDDLHGSLMVNADVSFAIDF